MADNEAGARPSESAGASKGDAKQPPQLRIIAQYVKDLSFENPHAPASLGANQETPKIDASVDVQAKRESDTDFEVTIKISVTAKRADRTAFIIELLYAGLFRLQNIADNKKQPIVLIECPRQLFPFARRVVADAIRDGGFPPLLLDPIDFAALYQKQMDTQQARQNEKTAAPAPPTVN